MEGFKPYVGCTFDFVFAKSRQHTSCISFFFFPQTFHKGINFGTQLCLTYFSMSFLFQIVTDGFCHFTVNTYSREKRLQAYVGVTTLFHLSVSTSE